MSAAAARIGRRSGSFALSIGVGTQTKTTSASARLSLFGSTIRSPRLSASRRRSSPMSSMGEIPRRSWSARSLLASIPTTSRPASTNEMASGKPT